ncbi:PD-(D/E)XK nuclease family protein [Horticoccus luteus]|uniref:PD-(D/E)XK nuclease family protein n=1 Tax=Horticoccus luteus TaxID=2862869 RepID=A0A8F9TUZ6_9BACT|nr:PD-(D/E)XK nuclease family protein [Horticoccus luteus]QYM79560.1 PD-(D/E)XK nuclease family protein [Horticoccus luteus]
MPTSAHIRRHFLAWDRPLLAQAVDWLARDWAGAGPLDLSSTLVVVPTRQSGRRLREALAVHAAARGQAVFPPRVLPPDALIAFDLPADTATPLEGLLAWAHVLGEADLSALRAVFPIDPPAQTFSWALRLARNFVRLQSALTEGGLFMADVATRAGEGFSEGERWRQLARLERWQAERLAAAGLQDGHAARIRGAAAPHGLEGFERAVLLGAPDPLPLALAVLGTFAEARPVDVVVFAPEAEKEAFDDWGRPRPEAWAQRELPINDFESHVHLSADAAAQVNRMAELAGRYEAPDGALALGFAASELVPLAETALGSVGRTAFNPAGRERRQEGLFQLLAALADLAKEASFGAVEVLARCPDFGAGLQARFGAGFSLAHWLAQLDELRARHLPATLAAAVAHAERSKRYPEARRGLVVVTEIATALGGNDFSAGAVEAVAIIFAQRKLDLQREDDAALADSAAAWTDVVRQCGRAERALGALPVAAAWELALQRFGESTHAEEKPAGALELQGWLELLWEDAPHLAIAGFNDGSVPDAVAGDVFLPESLRRRLGLKTNEQRFARDAYLLHALIASRSQAGRVDLLYGKTSPAGDPLRPSRLLVRCAEAELPGRIRFLFRPLTAADAQPAWSRAWPLRPRRVEPPARIAVTALRAYLQCPFRFYLRHGLQMGAVDAGKCELDALDFGTLCHAALERLGDEAWRDCTDEAALRELLLQVFDEQVRTRYGEHVALPLVMQLEAARQRLRAVAAIQARERAAGWVIAHVERKFEVAFGHVTISGKIDRLDRHVETGAWRVLDYKTSDTAVSPETKHYGPVPGDRELPAWAMIDVGGKQRAWTDLQLPVYLHALPTLGLGISTGLNDVTCGYFNLPKAVSGTAIALWPDYTRELHDAAVACAQGVAGAVAAGVFWPPNEKVKEDYDDYAALFQRGAAASIAWEEPA